MSEDDYDDDPRRTEDMQEAAGRTVTFMTPGSQTQASQRAEEPMPTTGGAPAGFFGATAHAQELQRQMDANPSYRTFLEQMLNRTPVQTALAPNPHPPPPPRDLRAPAFAHTSPAPATNTSPTDSSQTDGDFHTPNTSPTTTPNLANSPSQGQPGSLLAYARENGGGNQSPEETLAQAKRALDLLLTVPGSSSLLEDALTRPRSAT